MSDPVTDLDPQDMNQRAKTRPRSQLGRARPWGLLIVVLIVVLAAGGWWWNRQRAIGMSADPQVAGTAGTGASGAAAASGRGGFGAGAGPGGAPGPGGRRFGGAQSPQPVSVQKVRRQDIKVTSSAIGSIAASNTAIVRAQVSGVLQKIEFTEGQQVRAGQVLALIDPRSFQASLGLVQGTLARDVAQLENAKVDLGRYKDLIAKDAAPRQQYDTQAALVRQLEGTVKSDQASVDSAKLQLSYTRVTAPIAGRVGLKQVDLGNIVNTSDTNGIVTIAQTRPIALIFSIPSAQLPQIVAKLNTNQTLPVEARDRAGTTMLAVGRVATVDNAIDVTTDTIKVKALFPNDNDALFPNQAVGVRLQLDTLVGVMAVPQAAVLRGAQGFYVYVVNDDSTVGTRVVKPGAVDDNWMQIEGQIHPGETVVIDGTDRLREGAKVEVIAADPAQRQGASAPAGGNRRGNRGPRGAASGASAPTGPMEGAFGPANEPGERASGPRRRVHDGAPMEPASGPVGTGAPQARN